MYFLLSYYMNTYSSNQKEDSYFKPLDEKELLKEVKYEVYENVLTEVGDMNFSNEFIEENFTSKQ